MKQPGLTNKKQNKKQKKETSYRNLTSQFLLIKIHIIKNSLKCLTTHAKNISGRILNNSS